MQAKYHTDRLLLDLITLDDHDFVRELVNTKGWIEFIGDRNVHSKDEAVAYINKILSMQNLTYWVVRIKETNTPVGIVSFLKRAYLEHFDIGFAFLPEYFGKGYAYEAANAILSKASQHPDHSTILATTFPQNIASIKLLTKLGLRFDQEIEFENEKLHVYSIKTAII